MKETNRIKTTGIKFKRKAGKKNKIQKEVKNNTGAIGNNTNTRKQEQKQEEETNREIKPRKTQRRKKGSIRLIPC